MGFFGGGEGFPRGCATLRHGVPDTLCSFFDDPMPVGIFLSPELPPCWHLYVRNCMRHLCTALTPYSSMSCTHHHGIRAKPSIILLSSGGGSPVLTHFGIHLACEGGGLSSSTSKVGKTFGDHNGAATATLAALATPATAARAARAFLRREPPPPNPWLVFHTNMQEHGAQTEQLAVIFGGGRTPSQPAIFTLTVRVGLAARHTPPDVWAHMVKTTSPSNNELHMHRLQVMSS